MSCSDDTEQSYLIVSLLLIFVVNQNRTIMFVMWVCLIEQFCWHVCLYLLACDLYGELVTNKATLMNHAKLFSHWDGGSFFIADFSLAKNELPNRTRIKI